MLEWKNNLFGLSVKRFYRGLFVFWSAEVCQSLFMPVNKCAACVSLKVCRGWARLINQLPLPGPQTVYGTLECHLSPPRGPSLRGSVRGIITESPTGSFDLCLLRPFPRSQSPLRPHYIPPQAPTTSACLHPPTTSHISLLSHPILLSPLHPSPPPIPAPGLTGPGNYPTNGSVYLTLSSCLAKQTAAQLHRLNAIQANCEALF